VWHQIVTELGYGSTGEAKRHVKAREFRRWAVYFKLKPSRDPALLGLAIIGHELYLTRLQIRALFDSNVTVDRTLADYVMGAAPEVEEEEDELEGADLGTILAAKEEQARQRRLVWFASLGLDAEGKPIDRNALQNNPKAFEKAMR
jgi:hypothetical protein